MPNSMTDAGCPYQIFVVSVFGAVSLPFLSILGRAWSRQTRDADLTRG